ncbi:MAG: hypothetical protein NT120_04740 [Candidatus Aenigmarchaeota archaeon]|nr:hypothetical protein [Candidatus Aenigmarchaeota archaeon]
MKQEEYENAIRALVFTFLAAPAVILIGMFAVGAILDSLTGNKDTTVTFSKIFLGVGGLPSLVLYFKREWKQFNQSKDQIHALKMRLAKGDIKPNEFDEIRKRRGLIKR